MGRGGVLWTFSCLSFAAVVIIFYVVIRVYILASTQMSSSDYGCQPSASCCPTVQDASIPNWIWVHISMLVYSVYNQFCVISKYVWAIGLHLLRVLKYHNHSHTSEAFLSQATALPLCCHLPDIFKNKCLEKSCDDVWLDSQTAFVGKLGQSRHYTRCSILFPVYLEKTRVFLSFGLFFLSEDEVYPLKTHLPFDHLPLYWLRKP